MKDLMNIFKRFFTQKVGVDIVEVSRFRDMNVDSPFVKKVFSVGEISYCFSFEDHAVHLAGIFSAKEAASKALGTGKYPFIGLEIAHSKEGVPFVLVKGKKIGVSVSITHTKDVAVAVALA